MRSVDNNAQKIYILCGGTWWDPGVRKIMLTKSNEQQQKKKKKKDNENNNSQA